MSQPDLELRMSVSIYGSGIGDKVERFGWCNNFLITTSCV